MPLYDFQCECGARFEKMYSLKEYDKKPVPVCPDCGSFKTARVQVIGHGGIKCDSINDIKWMPSALKTLQREGERPIESRTEYNRYMKSNGLIAKG